MKRYLSILTAILLIVCLIPMSSHATSAPNEKSDVSDASKLPNLISNESVIAPAASGVIQNSSIIEDGFYLIISQGVANKYLTVYNHGCTSGTAVGVRASMGVFNTTAVEDTPNPAQLWRIVRENTTNNIYSIRPTTNPFLALTAKADGNICIQSSNLNTSVGTNAAWNISKVSGEAAYNLCLNGNTNKVLTGGTSSSNTSVSVAPLSNTSDKKWTLLKIDLEDLIVMTGPTVVTVGDTILLNANVNSLTTTTQGCNYYTSDTDIISITNLSSACIIRGQAVGMALVQVVNNRNPSISGFFTVFVVPEINDASLLAVPSKSGTVQHDHLFLLSSVREQLIMNDLSVYINEEEFESDEDASRYIAASSFFVIRTHGVPGALALEEIDNVAIQNNPTILQNYASYSASIIAATQHGYLYGGSDCVILGACSSGATSSNGDNLVDVIYSKGAKYVIGFTESVPCYHASLWVDYFGLGMHLQFEEGAAFSDLDYEVCQEIANSYISQLYPESSVLDQYYRHIDEA